MLASILSAGFLARLAMTFSSSGGYDLLWADAPKIILALNGANPYVSEPWLAPYPPLYYLVSMGVAILAGLGSNPGFETVVWGLRIGLVVGHVLLAGLVYLGLGLTALGMRERLTLAALFLFLPSFTHIGQFWYHGDIFGLLFLAGAMVLFLGERREWACLSLSLAASFKWHPFLSLPLLAVWFWRRKQLTLRILLALFLPFGLLVLLPLWLLPGFLEAVVALSNVRAFWSPTLFVAFYSVLPTFGVDFSISELNMVWASAVGLLLAAMAYATWRYSPVLSAVDVVVLGTVAWVLPLRQLYPHYLFWVLVPFTLRGRFRESLVVLALFEPVADLTGFLWGMVPQWTLSSEPLLGSLFLLSIVMLATVSACCLFFIRRDASRLAVVTRGLA